MKRPRPSLLALLVAVALPAAAGQWYRYTNEDGVMVLAQSIPPSLVHKGYAIVGDDGKVIRVVAPEPTPAERAAKEAEEAMRQHDQALLTLYASAADVEDARDRKLRSIDVEINRVRSNMERLRIKKSRLEAQGAERERAGQPPSPEIVESLQIVALQIRDREKEIQARQQEQAHLQETFQRDLERVRILLGESPESASSSAEAAPTVDSAAPNGAGIQVGGMNTAAASSGH